MLKIILRGSIFLIYKRRTLMYIMPIRWIIFIEYVQKCDLNPAMKFWSYSSEAWIRSKSRLTSGIRNSQDWKVTGYKIFWRRKSTHRNKTKRKIIGGLREMKSGINLDERDNRANWGYSSLGKELKARELRET